MKKITGNIYNAICAEAEQEAEQKKAKRPFKITGDYSERDEVLQDGRPLDEWDKKLFKAATGEDVSDKEVFVYNLEFSERRGQTFGYLTVYEVGERTYDEDGDPVGYKILYYYF